MSIDPQMTAQAVAAVLSIPVVSAGVGKLLETVAEQIALVMKPVHIRREAAAEADARVIKAIGDERVKLIKFEGKQFLESRKERAIERISRQAERRQANLESIVTKAAHAVADEVSPQPVDQDWLSQFFEYCQDVSNEEMQLLWGKLLAGEVSRPGRFSFRTLATVKVMSREDADLFTALCVASWAELDGGRIQILFPVAEFEVQELRLRPSLNFDELFRLEAMGLLKLLTNSSLSLTLESDSMLLRYGCTIYEVKRSPKYAERQAVPYQRGVDHAKTFPVGNIVLTDTGQQLAAIAGDAPNQEYLNWILELYKSDHWDFIPQSDG